MKYVTAFLLITMIFLVSCQQQQKEGTMSENEPDITVRLAAYAATTIGPDISFLTDKQKQLVIKLVEAGKLADQIFWKQSCPDAIAIRDSLKNATTKEGKDLYRYVLINYGPYDRIYEGKRFVGTGLEKKPDVGGYYPLDMTKQKFEAYIKAHPEKKAELESQYTVVMREGDALKAVPFHQAYPEVLQIAQKLDEAAALSDNQSLKRYLQLRAKAIRTDDYYESDMAWMDITDNKIDVVIGPIENYEDALYNYKTAYECAVVVKDPEGTKELQMFNAHINAFEKNLPEDPKYIRASAGSGNILEVVNIVYFGGDFQKGVKTIAASLPNDPRVTQAKGGKKQMYKNMMEAKFEKIVVPIAQKILEPSLLPFVDKKAFTSFVTLHEVSHTLGRGFVYGKDDLSVRKALQERYSSIEECKADVLGMYNNMYLVKEKIVSDDYVKRSMVTYLAGLYRSLRFGAEEAHGRANLIQLNFLREKGAIVRTPTGKFSINKATFFDVLGQLAHEILTIEAEGDYARAGKILEAYGKMNKEISEVVSSLKNIPRDLDTKYAY